MKKKWVAGILSALLIVTSFSGGTSVVFAGTNVEKGKLKGVVNTASKNPVVARLLAQAGDKYKSDSKIKHLGIYHKRRDYYHASFLRSNSFYGS